MRLYVLCGPRNTTMFMRASFRLCGPCLHRPSPARQASPPHAPPYSCQLCLVPFTGSCAALSKVCWPKLVRAGVPPETGKVWNVFPYSSPFSSRSETHLQSAHIASVRVRSGFRLVPPQRAGMLLQWCGAIIRWVSDLLRIRKLFGFSQAFHYFRIIYSCT